MTIGGENPHRAAKDLAWQQATLTRLYGELARPILRFFLRRGCTLEDARDLKQEVFLQAASGLASFRGESTQTTWVFSIAKHIWSKRHRALRRKKRQGLMVPLERSSQEGDRLTIEPPIVKESPLEAAERSEESGLIRREIQQMPETMRQCTLLHLDQELQAQEIARVLQIPVGTVKSHLSRAKKHLQELFSNRQPKIPPEESS